MSYNSPFTGNVVQPTDVSFRAITLSANTQLEWPLNGNATNNYAARIMDVTATGAGLELWMPPANQASVGQDALIRNVGGNTFTVKSYEGATTIASIDPTKAEYIYITTNNDTSGTWSVVAFGVGNASPVASALAGNGLFAINSTLNQSHPAQGVSDGYVFSASDRATAKVWSGGAGSATLPSSASLGDNWFLLFKNAGTGSFVINTDGMDTLDYTTSKVFQPDESAFIISTGSKFITVGYGQSPFFLITTLVKNVTNGAYSLTASEASNIIQEYVGNLIGNVTITYPPVAQLYVISNQTTPNGHTLTITTGAVGSASVVVPAGNQVTVICDGTNFLNANTIQAGAAVFSLLNGAVGSPSLNFASEPTTGMYRPGVGQLGVTILGNQVGEFDSNGLTVTGSGTFTNGISGGTF